MNLEHFSAPYEADAQMAYMVREGLADFAITEDSELEWKLSNLILHF